MKEFTYEDYLRNLKAYIKSEEQPDKFLDAYLDAVKRNCNKENDSCETFKKYAPDDGGERSALYDGDYESEDKMVSHPSHYQSKNGIEVIDVIEAFTDDLEGIEAVCAGNAIKYLCRWNKKNGVQDLEKSIWYIQKLINVLNSKNKEE